MDSLLPTGDNLFWEFISYPSRNRAGLHFCLSLAQNSIRVLIPDANVVTSGFHDVTLVDMADATGPVVFVGNLGCFAAIVACLRGLSPGLDVPETD